MKFSGIKQTLCQGSCLTLIASNQLWDIDKALNLAEPQFLSLLNEGI